MNTRKDLGKKPAYLRMQNLKLIVDQYRFYDKLTVPEISDNIGLSRTTVLKINNTLLHNGVIANIGKGDSTTSGGKRPDLFKINDTGHLIIIFYVRYTEIVLRGYDVSQNLIFERELSITPDIDIKTLLKRMKVLCDRGVQKNPVVAGMKLLACVFGAHANIDSISGRLLHCTHFPNWEPNVPIVKLIKNFLKLSCPVYAEQWNRLKVYGETRIGEVTGAQSLVLIDAGWHGVVSSIILNGENYKGQHNLAGEIGHFQVNPDDDEVCHCGGKGCFEQQISLERLRGNANLLRVTYPESLPGKKLNELELHEILQAAEFGDQLSQMLVDEASYWFARIISYLILFFDPDKLILDGDYFEGYRYLEEAILKRLESLAIPRVKRKQVVKFNRDSLNSVFRGAAIQAADIYYKRLSGKFLVS